MHVPDDRLLSGLAGPGSGATAASKAHRPNGKNGAGNGNANGRLTSRQEEILLHCWAKGYYEIPRRRTLRVLADGLGITAASLSLLLRRAEGKLINAFIQQQRDAAARPPLAAGVQAQR